MTILSKKILKTMLGLLASSVLLAGCAQTETRENAADHVARVEVLQGDGTGVVAGIGILAASMFEFDSAELTQEGTEKIEDYRRTIEPELTDAYMVVIVGHTDSSGDLEYNMWLSLERAKSVADYLVSTGINASQLRVIGRGPKEPIAPNDSLEGRIQNRRVDILVVAEVRALDSLIFPSVALFERNSHEISEPGIALLEKNRLAAVDLLSRASLIEIIGHTDDKGDKEDNMTLSILRAASVRDYLVSRGHDASKMITTGKGETNPVASNDDKEGRAKNRRVEIRVLGRVQDE